MRRSRGIFFEPQIIIIVMILVFPQMTLMESVCGVLENSLKLGAVNRAWLCL